MNNSSRRLITGLFVLLLIAANGCATQKNPRRIERAKAYFPPSESQKSWALATCAVLTEINGRRHDMLGGCERTPEEIKVWQDILAKWWNTHNRAELLETLKWIEETGHRQQFDAMAKDLSTASSEQRADIRQNVASNPSVSNRVEVVLKYGDELGAKSITAWDFSRYISLCGWGYIVGYLTEEEAWERIMPAAALLQRTFKSWEDLGKNHVVGREFWSLNQTQENGARTQRCFKKLRTDPSSPWLQLNWDTDLTASAAAKSKTQNPMSEGTR